MANRWTNEEIDIVKKYYETLQTKDIQRMYLPTRSIRAIMDIAKRNGLTKDIRTSRGWTDEKVNIVKKYYPIMKTSNIKELFLPEFTEKQIAEFATKCLKLKKENDYFVGWSKEDVDYLIKNYTDSTLSQDEFGAIINKSGNQVCYVARILNLKKSKKVRNLISLNAMKKAQLLSKPQAIINDVLNDLNINQVREKIFDYYAVDSYLPDYNLIIEVNGDYWHYSPLLDKKRKESKFGTRSVGRDKSKHTYIKNKYGIEILYLWETDILNNLELCKKLILEYIEKNGKLKNYHSFNYVLNSQNQLEETSSLIEMAY